MDIYRNGQHVGWENREARLARLRRYIFLLSSLRVELDYEVIAKHVPPNAYEEGMKAAYFFGLRQGG
jgi:hypothetical protein